MKHFLFILGLAISMTALNYSSAIGAVPPRVYGTGTSFYINPNGASGSGQQHPTAPVVTHPAKPVHPVHPATPSNPAGSGSQQGGMLINRGY